MADPVIDLRSDTVTRPTDDMRRAMARQSEGVLLTHTLDGVPTLSAWSRSPSYGWTFVVGVPRSGTRERSSRTMRR